MLPFNKIKNSLRKYRCSSQINKIKLRILRCCLLIEKIVALRFFNTVICADPCYYQGMVWNGMEDDFSIFHTGNFLPFHFHSILKIFHSILKYSSIFHSILKFSSIFYSILPYQRNFRLEAMQRIFCCFAPLQCCKQPLVKVRQQYYDATTGIWYAYCTWFNA